MYNSGLDENDWFDLFVQGLKTPKLQDQQRNELEGEITLGECKVVLRTFSNGKSPGEDGFTWEFYNCFFDLLGQDLVNCFNEAYVKGEMSFSQRRGVISLLPKEDASLLKLANWRPITLLNVDHKIASKVIATRFEKVLDLLISFNFKWPKEPLRVHGTYISYDEKQNEEFNFKGKMQTLDTILGIWNSRNLTLFGKCLITKSLGISQLVHPLSTLDFPTQLVQAVNSSIFKFIWKN